MTTLHKPEVAPMGGGLGLRRYRAWILPMLMAVTPGPAAVRRYASLDYEEGPYRPADLVRLDVIAHGQVGGSCVYGRGWGFSAELSTSVHRHAQSRRCAAMPDCGLSAAYRSRGRILVVPIHGPSRQPTCQAPMCHARCLPALPGPCTPACARAAPALPASHSLLASFPPGCGRTVHTMPHPARTPVPLRAQNHPPPGLTSLTFASSPHPPLQVVDALCRMVPRDQSATAGRALLAKMTRLLDRQQFEVVLQVGCVLACGCGWEDGWRGSSSRWCCRWGGCAM